MRGLFVWDRLIVLVLMAGLMLAVSGCATDRSRHRAQRKLEQSIADREEARAHSLKAYEDAMELVAEGRLADAVTLLVESVSLNERNIYAWTALGQVRFELGDIQGALIALHKAVEVAPTHAGAHYNEGVVLQAAGRYHQAVESYEAALSLNPDLLEAVENLARCYTLLQIKPDRVRELVDQALLVEVRPDWRIWLQRVRQNLDDEAAGRSLDAAP